MSLYASVNINFAANYNRYESVNAQLLPPRYSAINLSPSMQGSGSAANFALTGPLSARFNGFAGIHPHIGVGIEYKRRSFLFFKGKTYRVDGNVGMDLGLDAIVSSRLPPHDAYTGSGGRLGTCEQCHLLRGELGLKGKRLSAQLVNGLTVAAELMIVQNVFNVRLATLCAIPLTCGLNPVHTVTPTPTPILPISHYCGPCHRSLLCPPDSRCSAGICRPLRATCQPNPCLACTSSLCARRCQLEIFDVAAERS